MSTIYFLPLSEINFPPNRHRQIFTSRLIEDLADSIEKVGLIHPPVVRMVEGKFYLIAGERRWRAINKLHEQAREFSFAGLKVAPGNFPCVNIADLSDREARLIELEENIRRVDLTWQERVKAVASLEELKSMDDPSWDRGKTAEALDRSCITDVTDQILVAQNLHRPSVAKAPDIRSAVKALRQEVTREFEEALGRSIQATRPASPHSLSQADFFEGLSDIADNSIDVFITDPPYGIDADTFEANMVVKHTYLDNVTNMLNLMDGFAGISFLKAKPQAHLYLFCDIQFFSVIRNKFLEAGWDVWPRPIIWVKNIQMNHDPSHGPGRLYECILFASKDKKTVRLNRPDVIYHDIQKETHAAQKPVGVYVNLLERSCLPGDIICDPFCGSGTVFPAANKLNLTAIGFDIDASAVGQASLRLEEKPE